MYYKRGVNTSDQLVCQLAQFNYNRIQACALTFIDNGAQTPGLGFNKVTLAFITCLMDTKNSSSLNTDACAKSTEVAHINIIKSCADSSWGKKLLYEYCQLC
ncbi:hypothetical protein NQ318_002207 [Aromia moschata]|uniref:Uncharacterized protein n=1 Tax=Aromia moschata TaxID=1265417 RepID=A0AAV8Z4B0_9CUCU|nr:hypothetical protein NQ318_002207 [Aromia moschata]